MLLDRVGGFQTCAEVQTVFAGRDISMVCRCHPLVGGCIGNQRHWHPTLAANSVDGLELPLESVPAWDVVACPAHRETTGGLKVVGSHRPL